ncbi:NAD(P)-dependent alcohol dehydrogenase [Actinoplanes sp. NPDC051475]|uniref:NAD(P)-dependent alcohol dehydrogenase n=1 Tax=Actinoplanes sp. NPDC051475 TaxID=3157225 RepID=UPI00344B6492
MRTDTRPSTGHDTMRAIVHETYGDADVLRPARIARPEPGKGEVLVRVHAAGLDRGTWHLMTGKPYVVRLATGPRRPRYGVPGRDLAGTVAAVGPGVTRFAVGEEVYGIGRGTFAEYATAPQDKLVAKPANLTFAQAAVVPVSGITALLALTDAGRVQPGQSVLVLGASGGVGSYAVQLATALGSHVTGVCGTAKLDHIRNLGAEHALDYTRDDFAAGSRRYDLILDIAGNPTLSRLRRALTPRGTAVIVGGEEGGNFSGGLNRQFRALAVTPFIGQRLTMVMPSERATHLERVTEFVVAGTVTPSVDREYPLDQARDAMRHLAAGHVRGKVAITI